MKSDIPRLMAERGLDAIVVQGNTDSSTDLAYLASGAHLEGALYLHRREAEPVLFTSAIEREIAQGTGYRVRMWSDFNLSDYLRRHDNDRLMAVVALSTDLLASEGVSGRVGFYGRMDAGYAHLFLTALAAANPHIEITGEAQPSLFTYARQTKDAFEIEALRRAGQLTCEVIDSVKAFIQAHGIHNDIVVKPEGSPLTIGDVKAHIRLELAKRNLDEPHENIFSQGRDGAIGHNTGQPDMPLRLGEAIVFDIFPRDRATGYFHDITRTYFLGYVPDHLAYKWQQVKTIYDAVLADLRVGERCSYYQAMTCDYFEDLGYATTRSNPKTQVGYIHSLGHGIGLDIHEGPNLNLMPDNDMTLQPGHVVTIEPGLYNPDEGWGIRIEDSVVIGADGQIINLSDSPYDPLIPMG